MMDPEMKAFLTGVFAWVGIPLLFAAAARLVYVLVRHDAAPSHHLADWAGLGILLGCVAVGVFVVRERLQPRAVWVAPLYAAVMLVLLFVILGLTSLQFAGDS
jgi:hypothetical protein